MNQKNNTSSSLRGLFVTATGTDVGKTYLSALMVKALRDKGYKAGYYKAALSGALRQGQCLIPGDAAYVAEFAGLDDKPESLVTCIYEQAVSPHLAARMEGNSLCLDDVKSHLRGLSQKYDVFILEGCGGVVCPLRWDHEVHLMQTDVIGRLGLPSILVTPSGLGAINEAVTAAHFMASRSLEVVGLVMNDWTGGIMEEDNKIMIEELTGRPVLAQINRDAHAFPLDGDTLAALCGEVLL